MTGRLQVTFRNSDSSPAVEAEIRHRAAWLSRYCDRLQSCRVTVEAPNGAHRHGGEFHIRIDMVLPGAELVVGHDPGLREAHTNVYVAIRDAFRAARRELLAFTGRQNNGTAWRPNIPTGM